MSPSPHLKRTRTTIGRRLDLHPQRKMRNPNRHFLALQRWALSAHRELPTPAALEASGHRYWRVKAPVYEKLLAERHTTPVIRRAFVGAMLTAAADIRAHLDLSRPVRIAVLLDFQALWDAEITLFLDEDYFVTFLPPTCYSTDVSDSVEATTSAPHTSFAAAFGLGLPEGFADFGGYHLKVVDHDDPDWWIDVDRWIIAEPAALSGPRRS